jgi:hypothetical protein
VAGRCSQQCRSRQWSLDSCFLLPHERKLRPKAARDFLQEGLGSSLLGQIRQSLLSFAAPSLNFEAVIGSGISFPGSEHLFRLSSQVWILIYYSSTPLASLCADFNTLPFRKLLLVHNPAGCSIFVGTMQGDMSWKGSDCSLKSSGGHQ